MKLSDLISSIKEFFLDFLGYFAPGFFLMILLTIFIEDQFKIEIPSVFSKETQPLLFVFISYILGYMIYSVSEVFMIKYLWVVNKIMSIIPNFKKINNRKQTTSLIQDDSNIPLAKNKLKEIWVSEGLNVIEIDKLLDNIKPRDLRNLCMSFISESDAKIYTFMFRSDLSRHLGFISFMTGLFGLLSCLFNWNIFKIEGIYLIVYIFLVFITYYLAKTFSLFLSIAYRISFTIFLAKNNE